MRHRSSPRSSNTTRPRLLRPVMLSHATSEPNTCVGFVVDARVLGDVCGDVLVFEHTSHSEVLVFVGPRTVCVCRPSLSLTLAWAVSYGFYGPHADHQKTASSGKMRHDGGRLDRHGRSFARQKKKHTHKQRHSEQERQRTPAPSQPNIVSA